MKEKDSSDEEGLNMKNSPKDILLDSGNIDNEEEKITNEEEKIIKEKKANPMNSFLNIVNRAKKFKDKEKNKNIIDTNEEIKNEENSEDEFEKNLLEECQKEDEENEKKVKEKEIQKKISKIRRYNFKDYFLLFALFMASCLNFNYLSIYYVVIGLIYLILSENLNPKPKKLKYFLEIFTLGYAAYTLLFKIIIVILATQDYSHVINNKDFYINLGVSFLHDQKSVFYLFLSFSTEIVMMLSSGYGIYISFECRTLVGGDVNYRKIKQITIRKLILISYIFVILFSIFNICYLTLSYITLIQFCLLLCSLKANEETVKKIYKYVVSLILFLVSIQIFLINVFNIPTLQDKYLDKQHDNENNKYSIYTQIGISYLYRYYEDIDTDIFFKKFAGYFFGVLSMISLAFISGELNKGPDILSEEELKAMKMKEKIEKNKEINKNNYILNGIDEIIRVISIFWVYYFRNFFSLGIFFVVFFSFYFIDRKKNRLLILYILLPMLFLTLTFSHISNIDGLFEDLRKDKNKKLKLKKFSIEKIKYVSLQYLCGHIFYILLMFLISSLYYFPKVKEIIKNKNTILSKKSAEIEKEKNLEKNKNIKNDEIENNEDKNGEEILPVVPGSHKSVDIAYSTPRNNFANELLYEDVEEENNNAEKNEDSSDSSDSGINLEQLENNENSGQNGEKVDENNFKFTELLAKYLFINIDKVTLVVMYLVSVKTINFVHLALVLIFLMQILFPKKMHYFYKIIISLFQLLFLFEFVLDLLKIYFYDTFEKHKKILELFLIYNDDKTSNDIEIYIYGVVYCFWFQYRAYRNKYIASLLENKKISLRNYIKNKFSKDKEKDNEKMPLRINYNKNGINISILYDISCISNDLMEHIYIWILVIAFIFFSCYFEMNIIFCVKLIFFFISLYYYIVSVQVPSKTQSYHNRDNINVTYYRVINKIIILYCGINTFAVFLYQFLRKDLFGDFDKFIKEEQLINPFLLNLPTIGFTLYEEKNLYYNFLPYFMTCFIFVLYKRKTKKILKKLNNSIIIRRQTNSKQIKILREKQKQEEEKMQKIKEEQNEFIQDKLYADKYNENEKEIKSKSFQLLKANIFLIFTKCYWFFLFLFVGIIYSYYEISLSILVYIIIFGFYFIKMFHRIISKMRNYIKMKSYYISKVVRFSLIEDPKHYKINRRYRIISFRIILIYSFTYFILLYLYGIFDLIQHGCNETIFRGCYNKSDNHWSIFPEDGVLESIIKSLAFIMGIYINTQKRKIIDIWWTHFFVTSVLIFDLYNQKIEEYYRLKYDELRVDLQKMINENNVLEKYSRIIDYNILIKIGLIVAGIDLTPVKDKNNNTNFRLSLQKKFLRNPKEINKLSAHRNKNEGLSNLKTIVEDTSRDSSSGNFEDDLSSSGKSNKSVKRIRTKSSSSSSIKREGSIVDEFKNLDIDENSPGNEFLKTKTIKRFLNIFTLCNDNKQTLSVSNSKDRIMRFLKKFFEELIIFLLICISLGKLNIWTFVYLILTFYLIATEKTMWKYFLLSCFIYTTIIIQSLCFLSNLNPKITDRDYDDDILDLIKIKIGFPWYQNVLNEKIGFFMGVGVSLSQVHLLWLEYIQIVIIFLYLDMFSYSIYQDILNLGETTMNKDKLDFESINLKPSTIDTIKQMSEVQFQQYNECLKCFDMNIGKDHEEFLNILKIKENGLSRINDISENRKNKKKYNLEELKNPTLKELIYFRLVNKENIIGNFGIYKPIPRYLLLLQEFLYMHFHCFVLILIIFLSVMIGRLISILYITVSLYYIINSELLYLGERYTYFKTLKQFLRTIILIDILIQGIYQTPFVNPEEDEISYKIFNAIGFIKVVNFENENEVKIDQSIQVFSKAIIYLLISLQILIYESSHFKKYYLIFLLENKNEIKRHSIINSFKFNNQRVKIFKKSLGIRQTSDQAMEDLKKFIEELNDKLKALNSEQNESEKSLINIQNNINNENNIINENNINNENDQNKIRINKYQEKKIINAGKKEGIIGLIKKTNDIAKEKNYLEVDEVKDKIKDMLFNNIIIKLYLFLHKHSASYRSIEEEEKDDFDIETIKGETKIKSIIEHDANRLLNITDLEHFDKEDLKTIELLFEAHFDEKKRFLLE